MIDTNPSPSTTTCCIGNSGTVVNQYGQSFITPADNILEGWEFTLNGLSAAMSFVGEIYAWTGTNTSGAALYTSSARTTTPATTATHTFDTDGLALVAGGQYIAVVRPLVQANPAFAGTVYSPTSTYSGGTLWFKTGASAWSAFTGDSRLVATFSSAVVPEPAAWALMIIGFGMAGATVRVRRRRAAAGGV